MKLTIRIGAGLLALAGLTGAQATDVALLPDGAWNEFFVADPALSLGNTDLSWLNLSDFSTVSFNFTVPVGQIGTLTVVDAGFSGDVFHVVSNGEALADTSAAVNYQPEGSDVGYDYAAALADPKFSRNVYGFSAGTYTVTGSLASSAFDDTGAPLNSTVGALRLEVTAVPEASTLAMLLAGLGVVGLVARRRAQ